MANCPASQQESDGMNSQLGKESAILLLEILNGIYLPTLFYHPSRKRDLFLSLAKSICPSFI